MGLFPLQLIKNWRIESCPSVSFRVLKDRDFYIVLIDVGVTSIIIPIIKEKIKVS